MLSIITCSVLYHTRSSIPPLLQLIDNFSSFSGYKINWGKSELMPISDKVDLNFLRTTPFKMTKDQFRTLGIIATREHRKLFSSNWDSKMQQLNQNIQFWNTLPIYMVGRINAIKMVVLPRFLYIPVFIPLYYFKKLDTIISALICNNKKARISKKHLRKCRAEGGFGLPNFKLYYWGANLNALLYWQNGMPTVGSQGGIPSWLQIEISSCGSTSLPALLNNPAKTKTPPHINNPVILHSLQNLETNSIFP